MSISFGFFFDLSFLFFVEVLSFRSLTMDDPAEGGSIPTLPPLTRDKGKSGLIKSMAIAGWLGFVGSNAISSVLYMVSVHPVFAFAMGIVLGLMGVALYIKHTMQQQSTSSTTGTAPMMTLIARTGAIVTMLSAVATLLVHFKAPHNEVIQTVCIVILSCGTCYSFGLVMVDLTNRTLKGTRKVLAWQIYAVAAGSLMLGVTSAILFGLVDVEDHVRRYGYEQWIASAVGLVCGALIGRSSYYAVDESMLITFDPITMDDGVDED